MPISNKVRDLMDNRIVTCDSKTLVSKVLASMLEERVWSVIVEQDGLPIGVLTDHDILRRCVAKGLEPSRVAAGEIASSPLLIAEADAPIADAMTMMLQKKVRRLYIVENGKVVGRIVDRAVLDNALNLLLALSSVNL